MLNLDNTVQRYEVLQKILEQNKILKQNRGAEVGVRHGDTAEYLLKNNPDLSMVLVDPYLPYNDVGYEFTQEEQDKIRVAAETRLSRFSWRTIWLYDNSPDVVKQLPKEVNSFDFVFLDGWHAYEAVKADIAAWVPYIHADGVICGHDISMDPVRRAVGEFAEKNKVMILRSCPSSDVWAIQL